MQFVPFKFFRVSSWSSNILPYSLRSRSGGQPQDFHFLASLVQEIFVLFSRELQPKLGLCILEKLSHEAHLLCRLD